MLSNIGHQRSKDSSSSEQESKQATKLFQRQWSGNENFVDDQYQRRGVDQASLSSLPIYSFILFDFYGILLNNQPKNPPSLLRLLVIWIARMITIVSMIFLLFGTGQAAFTKLNDVNEPRLNQTIAGMNSVHIKFYYRLSFHLKSYFCVMSYLYMLIRIKGMNSIKKEKRVNVISN